MKQLLLISLLTLFALPVFPQLKISENMKKLGSWKDPDERRYSDIWGYAANGREYAIFGGIEASYFVDVTNPYQPRLIKKEYARNFSHRDFKVYSHYAYEISAGSGALKIFDLRYLPDSVHLISENPAVSTSAHTLFIDNQKLYLTINSRIGMGGAPLEVFSLANPEQPTLIGSFYPPGLPPSATIHAVYVKNDTAYCSIPALGIAIYNLADINNPVMIGSITSYPGQGYNHSNWVTSDSKKIVFADELPNGMPMKLYDISDPTDPVFLSTFSTNTPATPHNCFIVNDRFVFVSNYLDGVQVYDVADPMQVKRIGYYDTYPDNGKEYPTDMMSHIDGNYGIYPYLPSGNILASDMKHGLFILKMEEGYSEVLEAAASAPRPAGMFNFFPNPASNSISFFLEKPVKNLRFDLFDALGRKVKAVSYTEVQEDWVDISHLSDGLYLLRVKGDGFSETHKFLVRK